MIHFQPVLSMGNVLKSSELVEGSPRGQHPVLAQLTMKVDMSTTDRLQILPDKYVKDLVAGIGSIRPAKNSARGKPGTSGEEDCWVWCGYLSTNIVLLMCVVCSSVQSWVRDV